MQDFIHFFGTTGDKDILKDNPDVATSELSSKYGIDVIAAKDDIILELN